jgi:hypothetical protein
MNRLREALNIASFNLVNDSPATTAAFSLHEYLPIFLVFRRRLHAQIRFSAVIAPCIAKYPVLLGQWPGSEFSFAHIGGYGANCCPDLRNYLYRMKSGSMPQHLVLMVIQRLCSALAI